MQETATRVEFVGVDASAVADVFTDRALALLATAHDRFEPRRRCPRCSQVVKMRT